jgi:hypothetical protein
VHFQWVVLSVRTVKACQNVSDPLSGAINFVAAHFEAPALIEALQNRLRPLSARRGPAYNVGNIREDGASEAYSEGEHYDRRWRRGRARSLDEAPEPSAPVRREDNIIGTVEDCRCYRWSNRHLGRSSHARPTGYSGLCCRLKSRID